jgi:Kdo2-lipid IVA lauroyltransferase/acyltransferase
VWRRTHAAPKVRTSPRSPRPAKHYLESELHKYRIHFAPALQLVRTGDIEADVIANTALFTRTIEDYVRRCPDQWLWVHRRWKTRPPGEPSLY